MQLAHLAVHGRTDLWSSCFKKTGTDENDDHYRIAYNVDKTEQNALLRSRLVYP